MVSTPRLYPISRSGPGRLWTMAAPEGDDRLEEQIELLRDAGVTIHADDVARAIFADAVPAAPDLEDAYLWLLHRNGTAS